MPNIEMVREFYANAYLPPNALPSYLSFVRGKQISFRAEDINSILESTLSRPEGYGWWLQNINYSEILKVVGTPQAEYHPPQTTKHILRQHLTPEAKVWTTFIHSNICPVSHTSDITEQRYHILYCIMAGYRINIGFQLQQTIWASAKSFGQGPLHLPGMITLLCQAAGLDITQGSRQKLRDPIDDAYVRNHCQPDTQGASSSAPPSSSTAPPAAAEPFASRFRQRGRFLQRQEFMAAMEQRAAREEALYRSQTFIMDSLRSLSLHLPGASVPSADVYSAHVAWPQYPGDQDFYAGGMIMRRSFSIERLTWLWKRLETRQMQELMLKPELILRVAPGMRMEQLMMMPMGRHSALVTGDYFLMIRTPFYFPLHLMLILFFV